jgi:glycerophosphoryl diester phosphodiesterase
MRNTPQLRALHWLVARPIAHRGLHNEAEGRVENCAASFAAALAHDYAIECDIQLTADGEAVVFHDDEVDRVLDGHGRVKDFTAHQLQKMPFRQGKDSVQKLSELLEQVNGRATLVIEIKSLWDGNLALTDRAVHLLAHYKGPFALMSFDPDFIARLADTAPHLVRGITADRVIDPYYDPLPLAKRIAMRDFAHLPQTRPHFVSFDFTQLPYAPVTAFQATGAPVITWTIRSRADAAQALRWCDQVTFENFEPA